MGLYLCLKKIAQLVRDHVKGSVYELWTEELQRLILDHLTLPLADGETTFRLIDIPPSQLFQEFMFLFPHQKDVMKGFIDLFFVYKDRYYFLDWKTNYLGNSQDAYTKQALSKEMENQHYFLQASIYAHAIKRYVKLFDRRAFEETFGGAFYVFVRGKTSFHFIPDCHCQGSFFAPRPLLREEHFEGSSN